MKPELMLLAWAVLLAFVQMLVAVSGHTLQVGLPALALRGPRRRGGGPPGLP